MDELEDEVLFPGEHLGEDNYIAVGEGTNGLEQLERGGQLHPMRFALDLGADEELSDEDEDGEDIEYKASEETPSEEDNGQGCDVGTDLAPPRREVSLVKTYQAVDNREELSLIPLKPPWPRFEMSSISLSRIISQLSYVCAI